jgi:hypothetical protein
VEGAGAAAALVAGRLAPREVDVPRWFALGLCLLGAAIVAGTLWLSARGRETRGWTRTQGRVVASHVEEVERPAEEGGPLYRSVVRYAYEARGRTWESGQVAVGAAAAAAHLHPDEARRAIAPFPVGREVDVWFDPADPRQAVLVRGAPRGQILAAIAVGLALLGIGLFVLAR